MLTLFSEPYYTGTGSSADVPGLYRVAINGHTYVVDNKVGITRQSIPYMRPQQDTTETLGEQSLSSDDLWPRAQDSWHMGAGQTYLDRAGSDRARFRSSKGVDPWTKWELNLLGGTTSLIASANANLYLAQAGTMTFLTDGQILRFTNADLTTVPAWTAATGGPAVTASALTSDGFTAYVAYGASGVYSLSKTTALATGIQASYNTLACTVLGYVRGRLMAANLNSIYNITAAGAPPAVHYTHPNTDFRWVGFAEGQSCLYAAGYSGDRSLIYRIGVKADGTGLDAAVPAAELPHGEVVRSVGAYLGFVLIGTDRGVRFAVAGSTGDLTLGALIPTGNPVLCFEGQDRFVWYGLTGYDATSTGLGRLDLTAFTSSLTPAYASDLMTAGTSAVQAVISCGADYDRRAFTVSGLGVFAETSAKVASGTLDTGFITYGIPYDKVAISADIRLRALAGTYELALSRDGAGFTSVGTAYTAGATSASFPTAQAVAETFELRHTLTRDAAVTSTGPTVTRWTLRASPAPPMGEVWEIPLLMHEALFIDGGTVTQDVQQELAFLYALRADRRLATFQVGSESHSVFVENYKWQSYSEDAASDWTGTLTLQLKSLSE